MSNSQPKAAKKARWVTTGIVVAVVAVAYFGSVMGRRSMVFSALAKEYAEGAYIGVQDAELPMRRAAFEGRAPTKEEIAECHRLIDRVRALEHLSAEYRWAARFPWIRVDPGLEFPPDY